MITVIIANILLYGDYGDALMLLYVAQAKTTSDRVKW